MYRVRGKWLANVGRMYRVRPIFQNGHFGEYSNLPKLVNFWRVLEFDKFAGEWPLLSFSSLLTSISTPDNFNQAKNCYLIFFCCCCCCCSCCYLKDVNPARVANVIGCRSDANRTRRRRQNQLRRRRRRRRGRTRRRRCQIVENVCRLYNFDK